MIRYPALILLLLAASSWAAPVVTVGSGRLEGASDGDIDVFKGIPYAAPPTGDLRWRPPQPVEAWRGTREATDYGPACPQPPRPDRARDFGPQSEDCLTLNVWAPSNAGNAPVMVWIHGGAFRIGKGGTDFYDGTKFAEQGIVFVSLNYRLGYLGFFAHPALTAANAGNEPLGNYGLMDQIAALGWVRRNIAAFGGDPGKVTLFGESAGGASVLFLMTIAEVAPLFHQAIVQSGGGTQRARYLSRDLPGVQSLASTGVMVAERLGVDDAEDPVAALRELPAEKIVASGFDDAGIGYGPVIDGRLITSTIFESFASGKAAKIPLVIGANSYEASVLRAFGTSASDLLDRLGPLGDEALRVYAGESGGDEDYAAELIFGDVSFVASARAIAGIQAKAAPTWLYHLDFVRELARDSVKGANHGADVILVFDNLDAFPMSRLLFTDGDRQVARTMHQYWVNFAKTGDPNGKEVPRWPPYDTASDALLYIGNDRIGSRSHYRDDQMSFATRILQNRSD